jgi:IS5 family transposase
LIEELHVNNAFMYFCSVSYDDIKKCNEGKKKIIHHTTLVKTRKRLGSKSVKKIEKLFMRELITKKIIEGKYLFTDTTSLEKKIIYPTEIGLLKRVIEEAEVIRQKIRYKKDLVKTEVIKKAKQIAKVYYSAGKKSKELLEGCSKGLIMLAKEGIRIAEDTVQTVGGEVTARYEKLKRVGVKVVEQVEMKLAGQKAADKIVSYYEEHTRALPKGKISKPCEFGVKLRVDMSGNGYITGHELYKGNYADVNMLEDAVDQHAEIFKEEFKGGGMDRVKLAIPHRKDRNHKMSKYREKLYRKRSAIEAKISEGKRMCGLDKSLYKGYKGDEMWAALSIMAMNIRQLLRSLDRKPRLIRRFA